MDFEWNTTLTLGAIATLLSLTVRFVWRKFFSPKIKVKNGDLSFAQSGSIDGQGNVGIATSGDGNHYHIHSPQPKCGEKEKRDATTKIRDAFDKFFWAFLGKGDFKGELHTPLNLDGSNLRAFKKDRECTIRMNLEGGKKILEEQLKVSLPILEDSEMEGDLDDLRQKLVDIYLKDPFDITKELKEETLTKVDKILNRRKS